MDQISITGIFKHANTLTYEFKVTERLSQYFTGEPFVIEYPCDISEVPDSIAVIPFVCNVLPIVWLTDSELVLPEIDRAFYECIPNVKKGYETMFPESTFDGKITAERIVACDKPAQGKCAVFFSGGLDATQTLVSHFDEEPDLISIWGSDIRYDNPDGWDVVHAGIAEVAQRFNLADIVIRSSFRIFDDEGALGGTFSGKLKDGWWHGVKHGIGLLGHAAPYAYLNGLSTVYIASSNCPADGPVRCASNPLIDNHVRFANCRVVHDGFEFSRQDKVHNVVAFQQKTGHKITLHVCWESQSGGNCCRCEKCYRTMAGLLAEGADPMNFGFTLAAQTIPHLKNNLVCSRAFTATVAEHHWLHIQNGMRNNIGRVKEMKYWKHIRWILKADFRHIDTIKPSILYRIRRRLSRCQLYRILHKFIAKR